MTINHSLLFRPLAVTKADHIQFRIGDHLALNPVSDKFGGEVFLAEHHERKSGRSFSYGVQAAFTLRERVLP